MPLRNGQECAIWCVGAYGPTFGGGRDLHISISNHPENPCRSYLGHTYECPPGTHSTFFTGAVRFTVTDYEVFGLHTLQQTDERRSVQVTFHHS